MEPDVWAGQLVWCAIPGPELRPDDRRALADLGPCGVILFDRNLKSPAQTRDLTGGLREICASHPLIGIDQEGGSVNRLASLDPLFLDLPAARAQARWPVGRLERGWQALGECLVALGFDVDFAPVVDLDASDGENGIGPRSFSSAPAEVVGRAGDVLAALDRAGVAGCLKHFPGLGGTDLDTHRGLACSPVSERELWDRHALPYRELASRVPLVMTAHAHYPAIDPDEPRPATYSSRLVRGWLRERIGFDGVVITDDLEMGAVAGCDAPEVRAGKAFDAGADVALFCGSLDAPRRVRDALAERLIRGTLDPALVSDSRRRLAELRARLDRRASVPATPFDVARQRLADCLA